LLFSLEILTLALKALNSAAKPKTKPIISIMPSSYKTAHAPGTSKPLRGRFALRAA
jgi:hypothetical protein